ncbi:MAG: hypothetical protein ACRD0B_10890 [Acidimicrobiales bacterium]
MKLLAAMVVGYALGARAGGKDLDQLATALKALAGTDELTEVVAIARSHAAGAIRELASVVEGDQAATEASGDVLARVRRLVGHD